MIAMRLLPVLVLRLSLLVAIAASAALVVEYANAGDPAFCGIKEGCFAVRVSGYADLFGALSAPSLAETLGLIPLPSVGLAAFTTLLALSMLARTRTHHTLIAAVMGIGGLFALRLLWLQKVVIQSFCPWCVAVDVATIVAALAAIAVAWLARTRGAERVAVPAKGKTTLAWTAAIFLALIAPFIWGKYPVVPAIPAPIQAAQVPGKLTIVSFTDFECPFCRQLHPALHGVLERTADRVALVRRMMPLKGHKGAEPAALAYLCTPEASREAVADKLYAAEPAQLSRPSGAIAVAATAGVSLEALTRCVESPDTRARLEADMQLFEELGGRGLPFTFVGHRVVSGFNPSRLNASVAQELSGASFSLPLWAMFVLLGASFLGVAALTVAADRENDGAKAADAKRARA